MKTVITRALGVVAAVAVVMLTSSLTVFAAASSGRSAPSSTRTVAGSIARAQFASEVKDREPTDSLTTVGADKTEIYFYTELKGMNGTKVTHRWEHDGSPPREQTFDVGGDRWRVWSSKGISASEKGEWKVTVVDGSGATLGTYTVTR